MKKKTDYGIVSRTLDASGKNYKFSLKEKEFVFRFLPWVGEITALYGIRHKNQKVQFLHNPVRDKIVGLTNNACNYEKDSYH